MVNYFTYGSEEEEEKLIKEFKSDIFSDPKRREWCTYNKYLKYSKFKIVTFVILFFIYFYYLI